VYSELPHSESGETAHTLILIGLIFQVIEVAVLLGIGLFLSVLPGLGGLVLGLGVVGILWVVLIYAFSYRRTLDGDYEGARTPTLVFAILSLLGFGIIPGILYIVAYSKLGDAVRETAPLAPSWGPPAPAWTAPTPAAGTKFCPACGKPNPTTSRFCAACGAPLL
jgi:hypothetical protein